MLFLAYANTEGTFIKQELDLAPYYLLSKGYACHTYLTRIALSVDIEEFYFTPILKNLGHSGVWEAPLLTCISFLRTGY